MVVVVFTREKEEEEEAVFIRDAVKNEEVVVFTRENRMGSAQHATSATPTR